MNNQNMNNITAATNESHEIAINITRKAFVGSGPSGHAGLLHSPGPVYGREIRLILHTAGATGWPYSVPSPHFLQRESFLLSLL